MKETMRKIMLVITVIFFGAFSILAYPMQEAKAGPLVGGLIPAGITAGAGAYLAGGLMLSGIAGVAGYHEYSTSISENSWGVWQNSTDLAKDSLNFSIEQAIGAGNSVSEIGTGVIDYLGSQLSNMSKSTSSIVTPQAESIYTVTTGSNIVYMAVGQSSKAYAYQNHLYSNISVHSGGAIYHLGGKTGQQTKLIKVLEQGSAAQLSVNKMVGDILNGTLPKTEATYRNLLAIAGVSLSTVLVDEWTNNSGVIETQMTEAWESMRDAGLVLPVDGVTSHVGDVQVYPNAAGDSYTDDAGAVYAPGDVTHSFPQPRIRTQDVPEAGVYVDTPALTGNPAIDETIIGNPAIPKTTTNINTGTTIANPDIATGNPAIPTNPPVTAVPPFDAPGTTGLDFTPLMVTGDAMTNKFPFSIPFDFVRQIRVFDVEPVAPSFDIDIPEFIKLGGFVIPFKMKLSFEMFDPIANIIRWGMIIIWDISLIFAIRKLLPE